MFCKQATPRMARYAAVVAAIIMAMLPSQALVCRHCLLHNIVELANEHTSDEHPHVHDSLNAECTDCCGKSHSGEDEGSHRIAQTVLAASTTGFVIVQCASTCSVYDSLSTSGSGSAATTASASYRSSQSAIETCFIFAANRAAHLI